MKQKFLGLTLLIVLMQSNSFAQNLKGNLSAALPLVTEVGIYDITVSDNIDVVLMQDISENVKVKASDDVIKKLNVSLVDGRLFLSSAKNLKDGERLPVYVWVNELENLTLKGNAFAASVGILQNKNLHISAGREAVVSIKSNGKLWFDAPENYQVVKEKGYFFVHGTGKEQ